MGDRLSCAAASYGTKMISHLAWLQATIGRQLRMEALRFWGDGDKGAVFPTAAGAGNSPGDAEADDEEPGATKAPTSTSESTEKPMLVGYHKIQVKTCKTKWWRKLTAFKRKHATDKLVQGPGGIEGMDCQGVEFEHHWCQKNGNGVLEECVSLLLYWSWFTTAHECPFYLPGSQRTPMPRGNSSYDQVES